jgi:hypothetical protein
MYKIMHRDTWFAPAHSGFETPYPTTHARSIPPHSRSKRHDRQLRLGMHKAQWTVLRLSHQLDTSHHYATS